MVKFGLWGFVEYEITPDIFILKKQNLMMVLKQKIHLQGHMNFYTKCHGNPSTTCQHIIYITSWGAGGNY